MSNTDFYINYWALKKLRVTQSDFIGEEQLHLSVESSLAVASLSGLPVKSVSKCTILVKNKMIRDLPIAERRCYLGYRARRFECQHCRKTFVERVAWKRLGVNYTLRYEKHIYQRARKEAITQVAEDEGLSEEAVQAIFEYWAKKRSRHVATH